jgi:hypothetical protein
MRSTLALITLAIVAPLSAQGIPPAPSLRLRQATDQQLDSYQPPAYHPVRAGEVRSSGFLSEMGRLPFGKLLGPVTPPLVHSAQTPEVVFPGATVAVAPPEGAAYKRGDTVVLVTVVPGPRGWGDIIVPTGLARIGDQTPRQTLATVLEMYGPIRAGQRVLPLDPATDPGAVEPVTVSGPTAEIIVSREPRDVAQPGMVMFASMGRAAGIRVGDFVQVRRHPGPRLNGADTIDDLIAVAQVVHVGEKSCTIKLTRVIDPDIRPGTPVVRISTLPG